VSFVKMLARVVSGLSTNRLIKTWVFFFLFSVRRFIPAVWSDLWTLNTFLINSHTIYQNVLSYHQTKSLVVLSVKLIKSRTCVCLQFCTTCEPLILNIRFMPLFVENDCDWVKAFDHRNQSHTKLLRDFVLYRCLYF
jgi:hypothetical protein